MTVCLLPRDVAGADEVFNPVSGRDERVYAEMTAAGYEIFWQTGTAGVWGEAESLTNNSADDLNPQITVDPVTGASYVFFWRDRATPSVHFRKRDPDTGAWAPEWLISDPEEDSRYPTCAFRSTKVHFAYEARGASQARKVIVGSHDVECPGPNCPYGLLTLQQTSATSSIAPSMHFAEDHLWLDWHQAPQPLMAYAEYDPVAGEWGAVLLEDIIIDIPSTRATIRQKVLGHP